MATVYLETLGCQMNRLDSELILTALAAEGYQTVESRTRADVILYNTCSVRQHAEDKVYSRLGGDAIRKRRHRPAQVVGVLGCMAQREGEALRRRCPEVDIVCAPGQIARLVEFVRRAQAGETVIALDPARNEPRDDRAEGSLESLDLSRDPSGGAGDAQAFVRVARGCDNFCAYCIVPYVRGPERSRAPERIVEEVRRLVEAGRSDVTLLGQTVNRYRWRGDGHEVRFADLLRRVADIPGLRRLWFVTSHPVDFTDDVLEAMRDEQAVCEYIHVPAQSGSDAVLQRMNRGYTRARYDALIDRARAIVPDVTFAGDFIVGFPGETEDDHAASAELIERTGYKNSFVFKYSPRPGTAAARRLADDVPENVKKRRNRELLAVQQRVALAHHRRRIGRTVEVHVEGPSTRSTKQPGLTPEGMAQLAGRTRGNHIVVFDAPPAWVGQYVDVEITDATALTLIGRACEARREGARPS